jgi:asparagine synthase (glutamine-hydrolysing)
MTATLMHRGPDAWGIFVAPGIAFGHTRLSIVDVAGGDQPMMTDRYVIVYNGEVYNYPELRDELTSCKGVTFVTHSDTEVVLKAFAVYGTDAFEKFNGQFAFAIWDKKERRLTLARDRYGVRPLYILNYENYLYFSSELKAFDAIDGFNRSFDMPSLFEHGLLWNTLGDSTVYKNIKSLPSGSYAVYQTGKQPYEKKYYEIGGSKQEPVSSFDAAQEEFRALLSDSVNLRLRSDVPVGAYLSGGIDSSVVTSLAAKNKGDRLRTFSVAFEDKEFDESDFQDQFVAHIGSDHSRIAISYDSINSSFIEAAYHFERPVFRTAPVPLFLLSKEVASCGYKVVLTGEGADEMLCGYDSFKELRLLELWKKDPKSESVPLLIKELYPHLKHYSDPGQFQMLRMFYEGFLEDFDNELVGLNIRTHNNMALARFFNKDFKIVFNKEELISRVRSILPESFLSWSLLQRNQFLEFKTLLSGYLLSSQGDRMSLAHGVEGRYPFLDHRLVERVFSYPDDFKLNGFSQKYLLRQSFSREIPASILNRPKQPYMAPDLKSFFRNGRPTQECAYLLSENMTKEAGVFDPRFLNRLLQKIETQKPETIGYRDNMIVTFVLSTHAAYHWIKNKKALPLDERLKKVEINGYQ